MACTRGAVGEPTSSYRAKRGEQLTVICWSTGAAGERIREVGTIGCLESFIP